MNLDHWLGAAATAIADWQRTFGPYDPHPSASVSEEGLGRRPLAEQQAADPPPGNRQAGCSHDR
jgi:hypothetical protein